jgi:hypothetical protein
MRSKISPIRKALVIGDAVSTYSSWERREVYVSELFLDHHNPRIPGTNELAAERDIIAQLIEHEDVYALAKTIATQGFYPSELLICVEDGDGIVVVEGNRRLASLKLLATPELAPETELTRFKKLAKLAGSNLALQLEVVIAPSRSATVPLVMAKHTREGVRSWEPLQQANYVKTLLDAGIKVDELPALTGIPKGEILKNLRTNSLYEMATRLSLDKKTHEVVMDPRRFPASTLERVSGSPDLREVLGISFDQLGGVQGHVAAKEFQRVYTRVIKDIVADVINTRKLNDAAGIKSYIRALQQVAPDKTKPGSFTSENFLNKQPGASASAAPQAPPAPKRAREPRSTALIARSFKCHLDMPRIEQVLYELQHLKVQDYENAVGVLLRIFVELSISHYLDSTGRMEVLVNQIGKKQAKPKDWTPSLRQMLNDILTNDSTIKIPRQALKALNKAVSDDDYPLSLDGMDQFVHNPYVSPSEKQLRQFWSAFEKLVSHFMEVHTDPHLAKP